MNTKEIGRRIRTIIESNKAKTSSLILLMIFISVGYIFFFNSTKIFGSNYDYTISNPGQIVALENGHTVKLTRSDIDYENNCIEYEFYFQNSNFDGCNNYNVDIKTTTKTGKISILETETICTDSDIYVVRAKLPKSWTAAVADITLKNAEDITLQAKFYSNSDSLYSSKIEGNDREYFLKLDTNRNIENLMAEIASLQETNAELESKIIEIDNNIYTLQERMVYMTSGETNEAKISINQMLNEKETSLKKIADNKKMISDYKENITSLQKQL